MRVGRKFGVRWCVASVVKWAVLAGETKRGDIANSARRKWGVWAGDFSLSLSLLALVARLCVKFKRLFYSFCRRFCSFHRNFISSYRKFFLFYRSFNSSFCLQKAFFGAFCLFEIFKCFICRLFAFVIASRFFEKWRGNPYI